MVVHVQDKGSGTPTYYKVSVLNIGVITRVVRLMLPPCMSEEIENEDGSLSIPVREPDIANGHLALGEFMHTWSILEGSLSHLLSKLLSVNPAYMPMLENVLGLRGQVDTITGFGAEILDEDKRITLNQLMDRVKSAATRRNRLVHGHWMLDVVLNEFQGRVRYKTLAYRAYEPSSYEVKQQIRDPKNKEARNAYMFSVSRIKQLSRETVRLADDVSKFNREAFTQEISYMNIPLGSL